MDGSAGPGLGRRTTLAARVPFVGVGLHSGRRIRGALGPAASGAGIVFLRTDLGLTIPALYDRVVETRLCTVLGEGPARVATVEHLLAALSASGVDDALIELDGPEVPIFDGSAEPFQFLIDCAGLRRQPGLPRSIEVLRPIRVQEGEGPEAAWAELRPALTDGLDASLTISFTARAIGEQTYRLRVTPESFRAELARARTFTLAEDVARLQAAGLGLGGGLHNAVVVDDARVLNPGGLRFADEFVRHKLLDVVGDLALAGAPLHARFSAQRSGHALNNRLLRALFADPTAWRFVPGHALVDGATMPLAAVAAPA
ncbi:MAG: UDP-3-O-acyl-N-acetylglucosamine deacetylase [Rhodovarius sp.]|nr:UDP-3-O-acyl-N-acetylglucosamine deacetylase [Rhodovarius sp.]MCX7933447.1 UDP-3-O-acyl-N-acetylglucosamine deacetylase [Rhodovarius sp.]MDW8314747.1 UDP-3-O-acyl-N-acetylglucosamine deacetylase [Rhodovarius sp.]